MLKKYQRPAERAAPLVPDVKKYRNGKELDDWMDEEGWRRLSKK